MKIFDVTKHRFFSYDFRNQFSNEKLFLIISHQGMDGYYDNYGNNSRYLWKQCRHILQLGHLRSDGDMQNEMQTIVLGCTLKNVASFQF